MRDPVNENILPPMVSSDFSSFVIERTYTTVGINLLNNFKCNVEIATKIFNGTAL